MVGKKIKFQNNIGLNPLLQVDRESNSIITVKKFFETHQRFIEDKGLEGLSRRTIEDYIQHIKYFRTYLEVAYRSQIDRLEELELGYKVFKEYLSYMILEKGYKPCTVNVRLRTLKCYLNWLSLNGYLAENYSGKLKLQRVPEDTIQPLTTQEIKRMLGACDTSIYSGFRDYTLMLLMLDTGIRVGESSELLLNDIDLKQGVITIRGEKAKTRKFRCVPISSQVSKLLNELIKISSETDCPYVFQSTYGGKIKKANLILAFYRIGKKIGLEKRCTPHIFRHTFAVNAVRSGMDVFTLQKIMGHSTLLTTRKYIQLQQEDLINKHSKANMISKYIK